MVVDLLKKPGLVVLSSDEDPKENPEKDPKNDIELGRPQADHSVGDAESAVTEDDIDSSSDSDEELGDEFDSYYDPFKDH